MRVQRSLNRPRQKNFVEKKFGNRRDVDIDRLLGETQRRLANTRKFLGLISESERKSKEYIREMVQMLEREVDRLNRQKNETKDPSD